MKLKFAVDPVRGIRYYVSIVKWEINRIQEAYKVCRPRKARKMLKRINLLERKLPRKL